MSGPKIIDVAATREAERLKIATLCARIAAAIARQKAVVEKCGTGASADVDESFVENMMQAARDAESVVPLMEMRAQAQRQLDFVKSETSRARKQAIEGRARLRTAAAAIDAAVKKMLQDAEDEGARESLEAIRSAQDPSEKLGLYEAMMAERDRVNAATEGADCDGVIEWLRENEIAAEDSSQPKELEIDLPVRHPQKWRLEIERIRAETAFLAESDGEIPAIVEAGVERVEAESDADRRQFLLDDFRHEIAGKLRAARLAAARAEQVEEWRAALAVHAEFLDLGAWQERLATDAGLTAREVEEAIEEAIDSASAAAARRKILQTLSGLGYELRTGMETAFVENGRIVVKRANDLDYGVELSALPSGGPGLLRTRVVRTRGKAAASRDERQRDTEREEQWCSDRREMSALLQEQGVECEIRAQRAAGEVPVPVVAEDGRGAMQSERREGAGGLRSREQS